MDDSTTLAQRAGSAARSAREGLARVRRRTRATAADVASTPTDGVPAVYAKVLDGQALWLATEATDATFALVDAGAQEPVPLDVVAEPAPHGQRAVRADLSSLTAMAPAAFDVVAVLPGGRQQPVWAPPDDASPSMASPTPDERFRFGVRRGDDGRLVLTVRAAAVRACLTAVTEVPDGIQLTVAGAQEGDELMLRNGDDPPRARFTFEVRDGVGRGVVSRDGLPEEGLPYAQFVVGSEADCSRIRRRANSLRHPNAAVMLPDLYDDDADPVARLRWSDGGVLSIRLFQLEPEGGGEADEDDRQLVGATDDADADTEGDTEDGAP